MVLGPGWAKARAAVVALALVWCGLPDAESAVARLRDEAQEQLPATRQVKEVELATVKQKAHDVAQELTRCRKDLRDSMAAIIRKESKIMSLLHKDGRSQGFGVESALQVWTWALSTPVS